MRKSAIAEYAAERQALSKFNIAGILRDEPVLKEVRKELRRAFPELHPSLEQIRELIENEVLKREVVDGEKAAEALKAMRRARRPLRKRGRKQQATSPPAPPSGPFVPEP